MAVAALAFAPAPARAAQLQAWLRELIPGGDGWPAPGAAQVAHVAAAAERDAGLRAELLAALEDRAEGRAVGERIAADVYALACEGYYTDATVQAAASARTGFDYAGVRDGVPMTAPNPARLRRVAALAPRYPDAGPERKIDPDPPAAPIGSPAALAWRGNGRTAARSAEHRRRDRVADVVVVGGGAAGAALTARLAARGADVVCLEQGDWVPPATRPKAGRDWELRDRHDWSPNPTVRGGPADYPVTSVGPDQVAPMLYNAVGGSTIGYGGFFWRLAPTDFTTATDHGFGVDWPIGYADLAPYFSLNERVTGVSGVAGDPFAPARPDTLQPPLPIGAVGERFAAAFERLGWHWWLQDQAIVSRTTDGRGACVNRGFCRLGCVDGALGSADVTWWPRALHAGAELRTGARAAQIALDTSGRARGVVYHDATGATHEARGRVVVLAGNGLGTPRLLLLSNSAAHPDGLANSSGLVGRNLMLHVQSYLMARLEAGLLPWQGPLGMALASREFAETAPGGPHRRGFVLAVTRGASPLPAALTRAPAGAGHHAAVEAAVARDVGVWVCGDDEPEERNRVELDPGRVDAHGLPGVRIDYRLSDESVALGEQAIARARELCAAAGATDVIDVGLRPVTGWHLLGTARMGRDPARSVVGPDHVAHDVPNLVVADGSVMPTGGAVNPTNTIQALALHAADAVWAARARWRTPA